MIKTIIYTMRIQIKNSLARSMFRFCLIANPILNTILLYQMFKNASNNNFIHYVILGSGLMGLWGCICFSSAGDIQRERWFGTLTSIFVSPTKFDVIILGKILGNTVISILTFFISFAVALLLYRKPIELSHPLLFVFSLVITVITFSIISFVFAYLLMLSRKTSLYQNLIEIPFAFFCGFVFPIELLPFSLYRISYLLSPTWAVKLLKLSLEHTVNYTQYLNYFFTLVIQIVIQIMIIVFMKQRIEQRVRVKATLEVS